MSKWIQLSIVIGLILVLGWASVEPVSSATKKSIVTTLKLNPDVPQVDLFPGIKDKKLSTRVYPKSAYSSSVFITNLTHQPLTVKVPDAISSVHVLAQKGQDNGLLSAIQSGTQAQTGASQSVGGNLSPVGNNQKFDFQGLFTIPAEKTVRLQLRSVCLEHGKPSPSSLKTYELRPIESQVQDKALVLILQKFDPKYDDWEMVQAIAWNLSSHMNWSALANVKKHQIIGGGVPQFSTAQLVSAKKIVDMAKREVIKKRPSEGPQQVANSKNRLDSVSTLVRSRRKP